MAAFIPKLRIKLSGENCFTVEPILPSADDSKVSEYVDTVLNSPASFSFIFVFQTLQFVQQIYVKNVHPIYSAGIQTQTLRVWVSSNYRYTRSA